MHVIYKFMGMFHVVALPDSGVDGRGRYKLVSELQIGIIANIFNNEPGWAMLVKNEAKNSEIIVVKVEKNRVQTHGFKH
jgi:hypothetical protein